MEVNIWVYLFAKGLITLVINLVISYSSERWYSLISADSNGLAFIFRRLNILAVGKFWLFFELSDWILAVESSLRLKSLVYVYDIKFNKMQNRIIKINFEVPRFQWIVVKFNVDSRCGINKSLKKRIACNPIYFVEISLNSWQIYNRAIWRSFSRYLL